MKRNRKTINVSPALHQVLKVEAAKQGVPIETYVSLKLKSPKQKGKQ